MTTDNLLHGNFRARAKKWLLAETKKGDGQLAIDFELLEGPATGQTRTYFGSFSAGALKFTLDAARNCGWQGNDPAELDNPDNGMNANEVVLVIEPDTYEGVTREKVKWVNKLGGAAAAKPLAVEKRASFFQDLRARILAAEAGQPKASASPPRANGSGQPAGDVPF